MLRYMERSTIYYLKQKGWTNVQIAEFTGHHRDTVARVLREDVDKKPKTRDRTSTVAIFETQIAEWLDQNIPVIRMLELARAQTEHPYLAGETAFYDDVRKVRRARKQTPRNMALRFEGVPGEFLQVDWGEVRGLTLTKAETEPQTRYFFAARLKYSRYMYVSFHTDMREETLLRCLIACFAEIDGVPWAVVTDNMKTAVLGRDEHHQPIWNPAYQKLAVEFKFHPDACAPASGNQKGAVENLVKFVKSNFLPGRSFYDDLDLGEQCKHGLRQMNTERPSDATGEPPAVLLAEEHPQFGPLPAQAQDFGFFDCVVVSREGLVAIETNRYSVPAHLMGRALTARIHRRRIDVVADQELVATHERLPAQNARVIDPAHFETAFVGKPRGRAMVYRDWLCSLSPVVMNYVHEISHKRRKELNPQMIALYELAQELGKADFIAALELAAEQQTYGAEYLRAIVSSPATLVPAASTAQSLDALGRIGPLQPEIERDLAQYEQYVANRDSVVSALSGLQGVQA
jgi:transposase